MDIKDTFKRLKKAPEAVEKKETILIVDDLPGVRDELKRAAVRHFPEIEVVVAESGQEALDYLRKKNGNVAYVSLDVIMPGMNGFETYELIHKEFPELLAGFCTAFHGQKKTLEDVAQIHGFFGYIVKGPGEDFLQDFYEIISKALIIKGQVNFEQNYKGKVSSREKSIDDLLLIETVVGERAVARPFDKYDTTLVKAFADDKKVIGAFVDAEEWMVDIAIEEANKAAGYWCDSKKISKETHHKLMERMGDILRENRVKVGGKITDFDKIICDSNLAAYSHQGLRSTKSGR